jgi:hypothetical protein
MLLSSTHSWHTHVLDPDPEVPYICAVPVHALQRARAALQQRQQLRLVAARGEGVLRPPYKPVANITDKRGLGSSHVTGRHAERPGNGR